MIIIQCKEPDFQVICDYLKPLVPEIIQTPGGYINTFDKDWICVILDNTYDNLTMNLIAHLLDDRDNPIIIGIDEELTLYQRKISALEQYIFLRQNTDASPPIIQMLHAFITYVIFKEEQNDYRS